MTEEQKSETRCMLTVLQDILAFQKQNSSRPIDDTLEEFGDRYELSPEDRLNWLKWIEDAFNGIDLVADHDQMYAPGYVADFKLNRNWDGSSDTNS